MSLVFVGAEIRQIPLPLEVQLQEISLQLSEMLTLVVGERLAYLMDEAFNAELKGFFNI